MAMGPGAPEAVGSWRTPKMNTVAAVAWLNVAFAVDRTSVNASVALE